MLRLTGFIIIIKILLTNQLTSTRHHVLPDKEKKHPAKRILNQNLIISTPQITNLYETQKKNYMNVLNYTSGI